jgi:protocatechuate 3,4-dioxygenase beta subunit
VRAADPAGLADMTLTLRGPDGCCETTTNAHGHYRFRALGTGNYTVTSTKEDCTFAPAERRVTLAAPDIRARFRGTCP